MFIEPVSGKNFFGREEVIATLRKRVTDLKGGYRQNIALAGPMLTGKSSILRHFLDNMPDDEVVPVYIDLDGADLKVFVNRYLATLFYGFFRLSGKTLTADLDELLSMARVEIPNTASAATEVLNLLGKGRRDLAYKKLLDLTAHFKKETGKNCLVVLDEFHNLANFRLRQPFKVFGKYIMVQKDTMYVVSSSQKTLLKEILAKKLALLFGNFELLDVNGFDNRTARSFVATHIDPELICEDVIGYFLEISQGNPFYLKVLVNTFATISSSCGSLSAKENLLETLAELLYRSEGILNQCFTNNMNFFLEKRSRRGFIHVLVALARGNSTLKQIRKEMSTSDQKLREKLNKLEEMDLIYNDGSFFKVSDKMFEYWLKNVYDLKTAHLIDDVDIKYLEFKERFARDFDQHVHFRTRPVPAVVEELFRAFDNQKIMVGLTCRKMPRFEKIINRELSEHVTEISAVKNASQKWVCHVKSGDMAFEEDINALRDVRSQKNGKKISRRIFIPLKGVDQNALLLAKDKNIWVWDIERLNEKLRLLGLYELVI